MSYTLKRLIDITGGLIGLLLSFPILVTIAVAVRLTSEGPALFRQSRLGKNGKPFDLLKFRTMIVNAPDVRNPDGSAFCAEEDPRITRLGRWLRKSSLDELPQLWNVVVADMSLVGPRPDQVDQIRFYSPQDRVKLAFRPGLTGLAQISGRNRISWAERRTLDSAYVTNWTLWLDFKIIVRTIPYVLVGKDTVNEPGKYDQSTAPEAK